ncbi:hypothetical protein BJF79_34290 [Actinomadura sp. CNU-125]|nr:hypothetical protein BJF79_34290 [Actinomadura sp. CNU-125]
MVYEAYDPEGVRVAIKTMHAESLTDGRRRRLANEAMTLNRVAPFCTARVLAADIDGTPPFIVSEYVAGADLHVTVRRDGPYEPGDLHRLAVGIATALAAVHQAGVVHRDLKPANVLLGPDGPRVIDFGIARTEEMSRSATGLRGTPRWMAPEVFRGERAGPAADVWAWGAIVLFAATGRAPFNGDSVPALMHEVLNHEPDTAVLDEPLRALVESALAKDPERRPSSREVLLGLVGGLAEGEREAAPLGVADAAPSLAEVAERAFGRLDPIAQEVVPRIMLRLVAPGAAAQDTLRDAHFEEFLDDRVSRELLHRVLNEFGPAGLLRQDDGMIGLSSAALLRAWPRLREWVEAERSGLGVHQALAASARLWDGHGRRVGDLYRGTVLEQARDWAAMGRRLLTLNLVEQDFLTAASAADRRRGRVRTLVSGALAVLLVVAVGAAAMVVVQSRDLARQRDTALAGRLAGLVESMARTDPVGARRVAIAAASIAATPQTRLGLLKAYTQWEDAAVRLPHPGREHWFDADGTGRRVAFFMDGQVRIWDTVAKKEITRVESGYFNPNQGAFSADGNVFVLADSHARVWDVPSGRERSALIVVPDDAAYIELSPTGAHLLVVTSENSRRTGLRVFDTQTGEEVFGIDGPVIDASVAWDERLLVVQMGKRLEFWDLPSEKRRAEIETPDPNNDLAISRDGRLFAYRDEERTVHLIELAEAEDGALGTTPRWEFHASDQSGELVFSSDGGFLAAGRTVWATDDDPEYADPVLDYPLNSWRCNDSGFGPQDRTVWCLDDELTLLTIDVSAFTNPPELHPDPRAGGFKLSPDGRKVAVRTAETIEVWDTARRTRLGVVRPDGRPDFGGSVGLHRVRFSRDGSRLAVTVDRNRVEIWELAGFTRLTTLTMPGSRAYVGDLDFAPDGGALVVAYLNPNTGVPRLWFWDLATSELIREVQGPRTEVIYTRQGVFFHPDGAAVNAGTTLGVVDFPSGTRRVSPRPGLESVLAVSGDGRTGAAAVDQAVQLFDPSTLGLRDGGRLHLGATPSASRSHPTGPWSRPATRRGGSSCGRSRTVRSSRPSRGTAAPPCRPSRSLPTVRR